MSCTDWRAQAHYFEHLRSSPYKATLAACDSTSSGTATPPVVHNSSRSYLHVASSQGYFTLKIVRINTTNIRACSAHLPAPLTSQHASFLCSLPRPWIAFSRQQFVQSATVDLADFFSGLDANDNFHDARVDPFEPSRVWITTIPAIKVVGPLTAFGATVRVELGGVEGSRCSIVAVLAVAQDRR